MDYVSKKVSQLIYWIEIQLFSNIREHIEFTLQISVKFILTKYKFSITINLSILFDQDDYIY